MFKKLSARRKKKCENEDSQSNSSDSYRTTTDASSSQLSKNKVAESGPLGLTVVYPSGKAHNVHKVDIIFVHGLGGTSRWTWSKNKNPKLFWPQTFLPLEPDLCLARIMTFGYNSAFLKGGNTSTSILDFAKDLLFDLKYARNDNMETLDLGKVPLIFVAHSMGGLIVKEAYMQGQNDTEYEPIIKAISAITFLATPHRGTNLAQTLNRILDSLIVTNSKKYVTDLMTNSLTLEKLNEQFRHVAPRINIVSFYETLPTPIGFKRARVMILKKDSSVLGYPEEISKALNADHHNVCKYDSPEDPNYITVRNILMSLVSKVISSNNTKTIDIPDQGASPNLKALLAVSDSHHQDYIILRDRWTPGTNGWIIDDRTFLEWRNAPESTHRLIWLSGGAATGKSVMSSFLVNSLLEDGCRCQYFFITSGDRKKRTLSLLLRSLVYQLAPTVPGFLQKLAGLVDEAIDFETIDPRITWDRIFKSILFKLKEQQPTYWIIDGLDEAEDPRAVIKLFSDISSSFVPIRILFSGRRTSEIVTAFERVPQELGFGTISIEGHLDDLRQHIRQELTVSRSEELQGEIERRIVEGSQGNFLWVRLAVDKVNQCHTQTDVDLALQELPMGMEAIYGRMATTIANNPNPRYAALATRILECVTCSLHVLNASELSQALGEKTLEILDPRRTIMDLCGDFVVVDNGGNVAMIHQTARDYLLGDPSECRPFNIDQQTANKQLFLSSMRCLMQTGLRAKLARNQKPEFFEYAAGSWSSHLASGPFHDHQSAVALKKFLTGNWVLTWIHALAVFGQLRVLIQASSDLLKFALNSKQQNIGTSAEGIPVLELELVKSWAIDLLRIVGKFNSLLQRQPDSIYKFIPPFCPKSSSIYQLFGKAEARNLSVTGLSAKTWDDSVGRISLRHDTAAFASSIAATGSQIAVLNSSGSVFLYDSSEFMETKASPIKHGERVDRIQLNSTATLLATYGYRKAKIWEVSSGKCMVSVESVESKTRPLAILFTDNSSTLFVGFDDRRVRSLNLDEPQPKWKVVAELDEAELKGHFIASASQMAFSEDGSMVAIAYRRHPISAWETDGPVHIGHCWRKSEADAIRELRELVWHPHLPQLLGLSIEGIVYKWAPYDNEIDELPVAATKLSISRDGDVFATGDGHGRVKLYATSTFSLLYQLAAQDAVFGLTFSPDSRRLYDIRRYYANAWEPNILTRLADQTDKHIDYMSEANILIPSSDVSIAISGVVDSITAMEGSPKGCLYCCGTERGVVTLYDTQRGKLADLHVSRAKFAIQKIIWSGDGKYICFSDTSRQIAIISVTQSVGETERIVEQKASISMRKIANGPILQLLFQVDSKYLLVHTPSQLFIISLISSSIEQTRDLDNKQIQWVVHPRDANVIVGFGTTNISVLNWNLVEHQRYKISWPPDNRSNESNAENPRDNDAYQVDRVLATYDKKYFFLEVSHPEYHSRGKQFFFFETSAISTFIQPESLASPQGHVNSQLSSISLTALSADISSKIALALIFLVRDQLVFLSKSFGICSVRIPWSPGPLSPHPINRASITSSTSTTTTSSRQTARNVKGVIQELFALPGDWISRDYLTLCSIWGDERLLLCPRNGEAAVVKCAALA